MAAEAGQQAAAYASEGMGSEAMFPTEARCSSRGALRGSDPEIEALRLSLRGRLSHKERLEASIAMAAGAAEENAVSHLMMCFVPHDEGEDFNEDWQLDSEPCSANIDRWAPMCIPKVGSALARAPGRVARSRFAQSKQPTLESQIPDAPGLARQTSGQQASQRSVSKRGQTGAKSRNARMSCVYTEKTVLYDAVEEQMRARKHANDLARQQQEREAKMKAESEEAERVANIKFFTEEASKGPCTWDSEGNVIWVNPPNVEELPEFQASSDFNIPYNDQEGRARVTSAMGPKEAAGMSQRAAARQRRTRSTRSTVAGAWRHTQCRRASWVFTDSFHRPEYLQPPLTETMEVQSGVTLHCKGEEKAGPAASESGSGMRWAEYKTMASGGSRRASSASASRARREAPASPAGAVPEANVLLAAMARPASATRPAPAVLQGGAPSGPRSTVNQPRGSVKGLRDGPPEAVEPPAALSAAAPAATSPDGTDGAPRQAPKAPPMSLRSKSAEASLGRVPRAPRCRAAQSGSPHSGGKAQPQPPLGATMGHGLHCTGDPQEHFFFPATSNQQRGKASRPASAAKSTPKGSKPSEGRLQHTRSAPQFS